MKCEIPGCENEATGNSTNRNWSGYEMCDECQAEYNSRPVFADCTENTKG